MSRKRSHFAFSVFAAACLILALGLAGSAGAADWRTLTPLPDDLKIEPPGPGVSPSVARLSGVWQGELAPACPYRPTTVVVEKLGLDGVTAVYSWGETADYSWGYERVVPGWRRVTGTIQGDRIVLKLGEPPHDSTMYLDTRDGKRAFAESVEKKDTWRGWLWKKE
jgi:hypothetical protein